MATHLSKFVINSPFSPSGDQPTAIKELCDGINAGTKNQVLLGVTGSGKTFTMAKVIETCQRPALIMAPNKMANTSPAFNLFINAKNCYFYGYRENGKLVATALLNVCGTNGGIHEVATVNEYRNKGYATALIKHIIKESKKLGCDILSLQASVFGEPVYKKLGFNVVSSILNYKL